MGQRGYYARSGTGQACLSGRHGTVLGSGAAMVSRDAEILLRRIEANPADTSAFTQLVNLYEAAGDVRGLVTLLERRAETMTAAGADPADVSGLHLEAGEIYEKRLGRTDRALHHYRKAFEQDASCVPALYAAREIYRGQGNMKAAAVLYDLEANAEPDPNRRVALYRELAYVRYQDLGDLDGGLVALQRAYALSPQDTALLGDLASLLLARADRALTMPGGEASAAADRAKAADAYAALAPSLEPEDAVRTLEAALDASPGCEEALLQLDEHTRGAGGDVAVLAPRYRAFLAAAPEAELGASVRRTLGYVAMQKGDIDEAIACFEGIVLRDQSDAEVTGWLADLQAQAGAEKKPSRPPSRSAVAAVQPAAAPAPRERVPTPGGVIPEPPRERKASTPPLPPPSPRDRRASGEMPRVSSEVSAASGADVVTRLRRDAVALAARGDADAAAQRMAEILEIDPGDPEATSFLEDHYGDRQDWAALRELLMLSVRVPGASVDARKSRLRQVATIAEERQNDFAGAAAAWKAALTIDPTDRAIRENLHRTLEEGRLWDDYVKVLDKELLASADKAEKLALTRRIGEIHKKERGDPAAAVPHLRKAFELDRTDETTRGNLEECLEASEAFDELIALLRASADAAKDPAVAAGLRKKAARVLHEKVGDGEAAIALCKAVIATLPDDEEALGRMESIDEAGENWERLAETYQHRLDRAAGAEAKVMCLSRLARLAEERLGDDIRALDVWRRALDQKPADSESLSAMERLLDRHGRFDDLRAVLEAALAVTTDVQGRAEIHRRLARLYDGALEDPQRAQGEWGRVLDAAEDDEALRAMLAHARSDRNARDMVDLLGRIDARTSDPIERGVLLLERADLQAKELSDDAGAIETFRKLLADADPSSAQALAGLRASLERLEKWDEAADAMEKELPLRSEPAEYRGISIRLGETYRHRLSDGTRAIATYERLREKEPKDGTVRDALEALYAEAGLHEKSLALHRERADDESGQAKSARLQRMAEISETGRGDAAAAFELLREAFDVDRDDGDVLDAIRGVATRGKLHEPLVALLFEIAQAAEGTQKASRLREISSVFEKLAVDPSRALEALLQAFALDPDDWTHLDDVDRITTGGALFERAGQVYEALVRREGDAEKKARLLRRYAALVRTGPKDPSAAMDLEVRALAQQPKDPAILESIDELGIETERFEDLLIVYDRLRSIAPAEEHSTWLLRSYGIATRHLKDEERSAQLLRQALKTGAERPEVHQEAERVAADLDAAAPADDRMRGTRALVEAYREVASELEGTRSQGTLLVRVARLVEHAFDDLQGAFAAYQEALSTDPSFEAAFAEAERLARELGDFAAIAATYETVLKDAIDPTVVRPVRRRLARILAHELGRGEEAADHLWRIVQVDAGDAEARRDLEEIYEKAGRWNDLLLLLERDEGKGSAEERLALARRVASIWDEKLHNHYEALEAWEAVEKLAPADADAKAAIARLKAEEKRDPDEDDDLFRDSVPPPKFDLEAEEREEAAPPPPAAAAPPAMPESESEPEPERSIDESTVEHRLADEAPVEDDADAIAADDAIIEEEAEVSPDGAIDSLQSASFPDTPPPEHTVPETHVDPPVAAEAPVEEEEMTLDEIEEEPDLTPPPRRGSLPPPPPPPPPKKS